jgi:L-threonylcarbamoyladenylate synthase
MDVANHAADILGCGGVIAYPTESVFGLGCLPARLDAVTRILEIKRRDSAKGLILIAARAEQLAGWIKLPEDAALPPIVPARPTTWLVPPGPLVNQIIRGGHSDIAVRLTSNAVARSICELLNSPLVSTSANLSGYPCTTNADDLRRQFSHLVDYIVPGRCGPGSEPAPDLAFGASEIRNLLSGEIVRPLQS